jgi:hypothetical protein
MHCNGDGIETEPVDSLVRFSPSNGSVLRRWMVGIAALTPPYALQIAERVETIVRSVMDDPDSRIRLSGIK